MCVWGGGREGSKNTGGGCPLCGRIPGVGYCKQYCLAMSRVAESQAGIRPEAINMYR